MVCCLFVQEQRSRINVFLHSRGDISQQQALSISKQFAKQIAQSTDVRGEIIIFSRFRAVYMLVNQVYAVSVGYVNDYPFDVLRCCNKVKSLLIEECKGVEVTTMALMKRYGQLLLSLEELVNHPYHVHTPVPFHLLNGSGSTTLGRFTIKQKKVEKLIENHQNEVHTQAWSKAKQEIENHDKRLEILKKFSFTPSNPVQDGQVEQKIENEFGNAFTAPEESTSNMPTSRSLEDLFSNRQVSEKLKQVEESLTKQSLEMFDNNFGVTSTALPIKFAQRSQILSQPIFEEPPLSARGKSSLVNFTPLQIDATTSDTDNSLSETSDQSETNVENQNNTSVASDGDKRKSGWKIPRLRLPSFKKDRKSPRGMPSSRSPRKEIPVKKEPNKDDFEVSFPPTQEEEINQSKLPPKTSPINESQSTSTLNDNNAPKEENEEKKQDLDEFDVEFPPEEPQEQQETIKPIEPIKPIEKPQTIPPPPKIAPPTTIAPPPKIAPPKISPPPKIAPPKIDKQPTTLEELLSLPPLQPTPLENVPPPMTPSTMPMKSMEPTSIPPPMEPIPPPMVPTGSITRPKEPINKLPEPIKPISKSIEKSITNQDKSSNSPIIVFDPNEVLKKDKAQLIPLSVIVTEIINTTYRNEKLESYKLIGQIGVELFTNANEAINVPYIDFKLHIKDISRIDGIQCNPKYCKQRDKNRFVCRVPSSLFTKPKDQVVLLRFIVKKDFRPEPLKFLPRVQLTDTSINFMLLYKVNPATPLKSASFLVTPVDKSSCTGLHVTNLMSKPEGKWSTQSEKLLWRLTNVKYTEKQKDCKLLASFKTNTSPKTIVHKTGPVLVKYEGENVSLTQIVIDGCDSKRSIDNQVFMGGCRYSLRAGNVEYHL